MIAGTHRVECRSFHPDDVLASYLALLNAVRAAPITNPVALRRDDVEALASRLRLTGDDVVRRLAVLLGATKMRGASMTTQYRAGHTAITGPVITRR